jgi:hypothetical protein
VEAQRRQRLQALAFALDKAKLILRHQVGRKQRGKGRPRGSWWEGRNSWMLGGGGCGGGRGTLRACALAGLLGRSGLRADTSPPPAFGPASLMQPELLSHPHTPTTTRAVRCRRRLGERHRFAPCRTLPPLPTSGLARSRWRDALWQPWLRMRSGRAEEGWFRGARHATQVHPFSLRWLALLVHRLGARGVCIVWRCACFRPWHTGHPCCACACSPTCLAGQHCGACDPRGAGPTARSPRSTGRP